MATFLEICKDTRQECGISGVGLLTVASQTGEMKRIVDWVRSAWRDIQLRESEWQWMRSGFSFNCVNGTPAYSPSDIGLTDFASWNMEHVRVYDGNTINEYTLTYFPYDQFRHIYMRGDIPAGKPAYYTITPDKSLRFYPTPNAAYTVYGDYYKTPTELADDADTPGMPARFHELVKFGAMRKYAAFEGANEVFQYATAEYNRLMRNLEQDQLPDIPAVEPLV